ncbi:Helix-turn-helix domain-containing protein [Natronincola peptidivorans]|uniref:Helix-turn-helix domain-containing protein n=1 Tax=Natronincola peptidivorans TaxID=426128 RepID=A0A1I0FUQ2_9FIRM|nr:Mu transposase C-terminal domain-containing protein [Natronincola peptidivorans]SET61955.1 Helix-turn-helix domain-containing protein [Natronincola peptidivorans]
MNKGLSIFKLANKSIKGWFPTSRSISVHIPFVSTIEEKFLYYAEYRSDVLNIERADIDDAFSESYNLPKNNLVPIEIPYEVNDKRHNYYPDFLLTLHDGRTIIAEIGKREDKITNIGLSKAVAAIDYCEERNWEYWLIFDENIISKTHYDNLILLKSYDKSMYRNQEIESKIVAIFQDNQLVSIEDIVRLIASKFSAKEVEMCVYEFVNRLTKERRLKFDIENEELKRMSKIGINSKDQFLYLTRNIHLTYSEILEMHNNNDTDNESQIEKTDVRNSFIDNEFLNEEKKEEFFKKRAAVLEAISSHRKLSISQIAKNFNLSRSNLYNLINKYLTYGEKALISYWEYNGPKTFIREDVVNEIRKIHKKNASWKAMQIYESDELRKAIITLGKKTNTMIPLPSYDQLYRLLKKLEQDSDLLTSKGRKKSSKRKMTTHGRWVDSIASPLDQVQVDANWLDIKIVTSDKQDVAGKIWSVVLIDVKTANTLGYSFSLKEPIEEDYMRALKCCMEPKDSIVSHYNCENEWPSTGIPRKILSDNGKIFISKRATDVLVKRFGITEEIAPPGTPDIKGAIEALFTWTLRRLTSRLPGYSKGRDPKELEKEVLKAGITLADFEEAFVQAIVDSYHQEYDDLRKHTRYNLWMLEEKNNKLMVPQWLGSKDELKLLLMKEEKSRKVNTKGISFGNRWYQNITMMGNIVDQRVNIRYDKQDISVIYVYLQDGTYYCEAYSQELLGTRLSIWEDKVLKKDSEKLKKISNKKARANHNRIISNTKKIKKSTLKEKDAQFIEQQRLYNNQDIHIEKVQKVLSQQRLNEDINEICDIKPVDVNIDKSSLKKLHVRKF